MLKLLIKFCLIFFVAAPALGITPEQAKLLLRAKVPVTVSIVQCQDYVSDCKFGLYRDNHNFAMILPKQGSTTVKTLCYMVSQMKHVSQNDKYSTMKQLLEKLPIDSASKVEQQEFIMYYVYELFKDSSVEPQVSDICTRINDQDCLTVVSPAQVKEINCMQRCYQYCLRRTRAYLYRLIPQRLQNEDSEIVLKHSEMLVEAFSEKMRKELIREEICNGMLSQSLAQDIKQVFFSLCNTGNHVQYRYLDKFLACRAKTKQGPGSIEI